MKRRARVSQMRDSEEQRKLPKYSIGIVSKLVGIPPQALRRYEEAGLLDPARQDGKNRLYSDENLALIEEIVELADQGINAVGIRYILEMRRQVIHLQQEIQEVRTTLARFELQQSARAESQRGHERDAT